MSDIWAIFTSVAGRVLITYTYTPHGYSWIVSMATHLAAAAAAEIICLDIWLLGVLRVSLIFIIYSYDEYSYKSVLRRVICLCDISGNDQKHWGSKIGPYLPAQVKIRSNISVVLALLYSWSRSVPLMNIFWNIKCQISIFMVGKNFYFFFSARDVFFQDSKPRRNMLSNALTWGRTRPESEIVHPFEGRSSFRIQVDCLCVFRFKDRSFGKEAQIVWWRVSDTFCSVVVKKKGMLHQKKPPRTYTAGNHHKPTRK